ncbi:MAG TPA: hypothetical protein PKZ98_06555, partial [Candidatus Saccharicenans sp.]|nr:hypothetical protein [Candidatus Saccharicenans sp.]
MNHRKARRITLFCCLVVAIILILFFSSDHRRQSTKKEAKFPSADVVLSEPPVEVEKIIVPAGQTIT